MSVLSLTTNDSGEGHMMLMSFAERNFERDTFLQPECEPSLDNIFKFSIFYDQMDFNLEYTLGQLKPLSSSLIL